VISPGKIRTPRQKSAFSLIEMVAVIAILVTLMTAGISLLNSTGAQSRKAGADMLSGLIEQARTKAITSRSHVILAIAEPGSLPAQDERCRIGLFEVPDNWLENPSAITDAKLLSRWQILNTGIALIPGDVKVNNAVIPNPVVDPNKKVMITYGVDNNLRVKVHAIAFNPRGGLTYPTGSTPIAMRVAEGGYRGNPKKATANERGSDKVISETRLNIGRVTARPYQVN
jgi:prepilin-type N-terminal cleavage/methylation domain-containing protein